MTRYWTEPGTTLYFEKPPNKPFIPRRGESFTSVEVIKADDLPAHDAALRAQVWEEAAKEIPYTWLDALLSGDGAIIKDIQKITPQDVANVLLAVRARLQTKAAALRARKGEQ